MIFQMQIMYYTHPLRCSHLSSRQIRIKASMIQANKYVPNDQTKYMIHGAL